MNTTAVSPAEIDAFLAEQCGIAVHWDTSERWTESLDALFAPGGPVEKCIEMGFDVIQVHGPYNGLWQADVVETPPTFTNIAMADTPAMAVAEACYRALQPSPINDVTTEAPTTH
jgi:hypothetical protein